MPRSCSSPPHDARQGSVLLAGPAKPHKPLWQLLGAAGVPASPGGCGSAPACDGVPVMAASDVCHLMVLSRPSQPHCWEIMVCKSSQYQKYIQDTGFTAPGGVLSRFGMDGYQLVAVQPG